MEQRGPEATARERESDQLRIDAETGLPLKRVYLAHPESEKIRITETYSEFKLNPKVDAKVFQLP